MWLDHCVDMVSADTDKHWQTTNKAESLLCANEIVHTFDDARERLSKVLLVPYSQSINCTIGRAKHCRTLSHDRI